MTSRSIRAATTGSTAAMRSAWVMTRRRSLDVSVGNPVDANVKWMLSPKVTFSRYLVGSLCPAMRSWRGPPIARRSSAVPGAKTIATTWVAGAIPVTVSCPSVSLLIVVQLALGHCILRKSCDSAYQRRSPLASRRSSMPSVLKGTRPIMLKEVEPIQSASPSSSWSGHGSAPG